MKGDRNRYRSPFNPFLHDPVASPLAGQRETVLLQTRTRSLPNRDLDLGYEYFAMKSAGNLGSRCGFKEERKRLDEIGARLFNRCSLAGDVQLRAQCHESVILAFNDCGHVSGAKHASSLRFSAHSNAAR